LEYLRGAWKPNKGVGFSKKYSVPDGDDTIITYDVLKHFGYEVDLEGLLSFEENDHFRCYHLEVGISPSLNIHAIRTLRNAGYEREHPTIRKILTYLSTARTNGPIWVDKWHSSPYYTTTHFVIACAGFDNDLAKSAVDWILSTQREDGSWGFFMPTAEETAYCLQALSIWKLETGSNKADTAVKHGANWLESNTSALVPPLWIGKGLYSADLVVRSSILSALALAKTIQMGS
jgi:halimadienyl-diphosphate synthase